MIYDGEPVAEPLAGVDMFGRSRVMQGKPTVQMDSFGTVITAGFVLLALVSLALVLWLVHQEPPNKASADVSAMPDQSFETIRPLPKEIIRRRADLDKLWDRAKYLPVVMFVHDGWASREVGLWRILRDAVQTVGKPVALACADIAEPGNEGMRELAIHMRAREDGFDVPFVTFKVLDLPDDTMELPHALRIEDMTDTITAHVRRSVYLFYGGSALPPSPPP